MIMRSKNERDRETLTLTHKLKFTNSFPMISVYSQTQTDTYTQAVGEKRGIGTNASKYRTELTIISLNLPRRYVVQNGRRKEKISEQ